MRACSQQDLWPMLCVGGPAGDAQSLVRRPVSNGLTAVNRKREA